MILNDKQIRELCVQRAYKAKLPPGENFGVDDIEMLKRKADDDFTAPELRKWFSSMVAELERERADNADPDWKPMIAPFSGQQIKTNDRGERILSWGLSSAGYDVRLANKFKIFTNINSSIVDPLNMSDDCYVDFEGDACILPPNSYLLGHTIETFNIPRDVMVVCVGKSTLARTGCIVNTTPIEPGFSGQVVIEISNATPLPMKIYANMGVAQFLYFKGEPCEVSYADRNGKYQNQQGITTARV